MFVHVLKESVCVCELVVGGGGGRGNKGGVAETKVKLTERLFSSLVTWQIIYI